MVLQAYYVNKQFRRAHSLMNKPELFARNMRYRYMAAMCLAECQEWDACLATIGADEEPEIRPEQVGPILQVAASLLCCPCGWQLLSAVESKSWAIGTVQEDTSRENQGRAIDMYAAVCALRGRAFDALQNRSRAILCYTCALRCRFVCSF